MPVRTALRLALVTSAAVALIAPLAVQAQPPAAPPGGAPAGAPAGAAPAGAPGGAPGGAGRGAAQEPPAPTVAGSISGVYRGKVTAGPNEGTEVLVWVIKSKDDRVRVMANRLAVANGDVYLKAEGGKVVQADGEIGLTFDPATDPMVMEYRLGPTVYTGVREQVLGEDL